MLRRQAKFCKQNPLPPASGRHAQKYPDNRLHKTLSIENVLSWPFFNWDTENFASPVSRNGAYCGTQSPPLRKPILNRTGPFFDGYEGALPEIQRRRRPPGRAPRDGPCRKESSSPPSHDYRLADSQTEKLPESLSIFAATMSRRGTLPVARNTQRDVGAPRRHGIAEGDMIRKSF